MVIRSLFIVSALLLAVGVGAKSALAQEAGDDSSNAVLLDEITVSARKREESLADVPIAVTAISAQEIFSAGFEDLRDLAKATPGFVFEGFDTTPGRFESVPFIRGITFDNPSPIRQPVSVFIDGVYVSGGTAGIGVEDVQRVEVIKGPQSALFGRATFAGAVNYITVDPSEEFEGNISVTGATKGEYEITGSVETGLAEGLTARLSGRYASKDGHYENVLQTSQRLGDEETTSVGLTLVYQPNDAFKARFRSFYYEIDDGPAAAAQFNEAFNTLQSGGIRPYLTGEIPAIPASIIGANVTDADYATYIADARSKNFIYIGDEPKRFGTVNESSRLSLDASYDFGNMVLSGNVSTNKQEGTTLFDQEQNPRPTFTVLSGRSFEDTNIELRLAGDAFEDRLYWALGVSRLEIEYDNNFVFGFQAFGTAGNPGQITRRDITTEAFFGQFGYNFTDELSLSLELRDQDDTIDLRTQGQPNVTARKGEFSNSLPRVTLDYKITDDTLTYVSYSEGNLPGGFNSAFLTLTPDQQAEVRQTFPTASETFLEETLESYEIGWKQTLFDGRANFTLALFTMDRVDQSTSAVASYTNPDFGMPGEPPLNTITLTVNAAATEVKGLEFEGNLFANENWSFRSTVAYTEAKISAFPATGNSGDYAFAFGSSNGFIGTDAPRYPELQGSLSGTYTAPSSLMGAESWFTRVDLFYQDEFFLSTANLGWAPASTEVNLRLGLRSEAWLAEAFISNLTDEDAPTAANNTAALRIAGGGFTDTTSVGLRDERQLGFRVSYNF